MRATHELSSSLYRLASEMRREEGCTTMNPAIVEAAALRLDEQTVEINELKRRSRKKHFVSGQFLEPFGVSLPVRIPAGGYTTVVVEVYALGRGVTIERERGDLAGREGTLELEAGGQFLSFNRLVCEQSERRVLSVEYFVTAIRQALDAVGEEEHPELERIAAAHFAGTPSKTAILQLPPATGKTTVAQQLAQWLGCIHVLDEWCPDYPLVEGALHLTNVEMAA